MFKVTKVQTRKCGKNWIKYMQSDNIEKVIKHFGTENILKVEECQKIRYKVKTKVIIQMRVL